MSKTPIIEMENVGIRYGRGPEILSNINLSLERGSFHYLTGKSGAGKTSLLSMMYLAQKPSRGNVSVFGNNVNFANRNSLAMFRRRIGVVFQDFRLFAFSLGQNVTAGADVDRARAEVCLRELRDAIPTAAAVGYVTEKQDSWIVLE